MGFFIHTLISIFTEFRWSDLTSPAVGNVGTVKENIFAFLGCFGILLITIGWLVGIPYYLHVIKGFSGWETFGLWWLITVVFSVILHLFKLTD